MDTNEENNDINEIIVELSMVYVNSALQSAIQFADGLDDPYVFFRFNSSSLEIKYSPFSVDNDDCELRKLYVEDFDTIECNDEQYVIKFNVKHFIFLLGDIQENDLLRLKILKNDKKKLVMFYQSQEVGRASTSKLRLERNV